MLRVSLIATILNEGQTIGALLDSLLAQTRPPDEVVLVDGGSQDNTREIIERYAGRLPIQFHEKVGYNISQGRNWAIQAATGDIIAATDAGVRLPLDWLEHLVAPFKDSQVQTVAGFFTADPDLRSPFQVAMSATVLPHRGEIIPEKFLPSSRSVAFRKSAWEAVGGYPEWLDYCEDLIFDLRLQARFGPFHFAPDACAFFKPRTSLKSYWRQYLLYARGDGKADLWRKRHAARYITYGVLVPAIALLSLIIHPAFALLYALGGIAYLYRPFRRLPDLWGELSLWGRLQAIFYIPLIRVVGDVAKMVGYPIGLRWRMRYAPPDWHLPQVSL